MLEAQTEINPGLDTSPVVSLATLWSESGKQVETPLTTWGCAIDGCGTLAFVVLKTKDGNRPVCLKHFDEIGANAGFHRTQGRTRNALAVSGRR